LEIEVKNIYVRMEEVEENDIVGGKRIIRKIEERVSEVELEIDEEKSRNDEKIKILRKKERKVKEVMIKYEEEKKNVEIIKE
jgi:hypothetical protein